MTNKEKLKQLTPEHIDFEKVTIYAEKYGYSYMIQAIEAGLKLNSRRHVELLLGESILFIKIVLSK